MSLYCHQVSYTKEAWARLIQNPQDRLEAVRAPIEKLGGKLSGAWFTFGEYDVAVILEMPDNVSAAALALAFGAGGACKAVKTTPLLSPAEAVEALKRAGATGYKPATKR